MIVPHWRPMTASLITSSSDTIFKGHLIYLTPIHTFHYEACVSVSGNGLHVSLPNLHLCAILSSITDRYWKHYCIYVGCHIKALSFPVAFSAILELMVLIELVVKCQPCSSEHVKGPTLAVPASCDTSLH